MGWFSNLFSNEAITLAVSDSTHMEQSPTRPEPYSVVREKITSGAVAQQITILQNLLLTMPVSSLTRSRFLEYVTRNPSRYGIERSWPHRQTLHDLLNVLMKSLNTIDEQRSDMKTLLRLIDLCNETLPAKLRALELRIAQKDWDTEASTLTEMENDVKKLLEEISLLPTKRSILHIEMQSEDPENKNFPNIEMYKDNEELYAALKAVEADWDKASKLPLTSEDDYVIERVGNSYLPDALLLFDRFCHRTGSTNSEKALAIVKEQVGLIHQQVIFVLEQHEEDSFDLMESHTEFLKMKNNRMGLSRNAEGEGLKLEKTDTGN